MKSLLRWLLNPTARRSLSELVGSKAAESVLRRTWDGYDGLVPRLPREQTFGCNLMLRLAALTIALDDSLATEGFSREEEAP